MSVDKLVDSTQLNSDLTSVANAIRTKGGTSASLAFPAGFVTAIGAIPSGGGVSWDDIADASEPSGDITLTVSSVAKRGFSAFYTTNNWRVFGPNVLSIGDSAFRENPKLTEVHLPVLTSMVTGYCFYQSSGLVLADLGFLGSLLQNSFNMCSAFKTLILRKSDAICTLGNSNAFSSTCFKSGGSGGTIYIPKALYDHLGDNSSLDYKAATNWSTVNGWGATTWAKIEGSIYEL